MNRRIRCLIALLLPLMLWNCSTWPLLEDEPVAVCPQAPEVVCPSCPERQCPAPAPVLQPVAAPTPEATAGDLQLPIIGAVEWVTVEPAGVRMQARIDTGAETTSIHAEDISLVERDGKRYVRFNLLDPVSGEKVAMEERLRRRVLIKQHGGEGERRYVVRMWLTLGKIHARVEVNLSDRDVFEYPLLVGRNFLTDAVIVDVSRQHLLGR
jgi:hypothetical protein